MASGDTKTESYLRTAAEGTRADLPSDNCCNTKTQNLIVGVANRIMDVEDEVEELKNNPDVVDIVDTYQDLQNYDTSTLTDKDIIRVLQDSTHSGNSTYYRWNATTNQFDFVGEVAGGSVTPVQTTGTSTTDVMSQDATTKMVYSEANPSTYAQGGAIYLGNLDANQVQQADPAIANMGWKYFWALPSSNTSTPMNNSVNILGKRGSGTIGGFVVIGNDSTAHGSDSVIVGTGSEAGQSSVAIGKWTNAGTTGSNRSSMVAIGNGAKADVNKAICIGGGGSSYGVQNSASTSSVALGFKASVGDGATGYKNSVALGAYSKATRQGEVNVGLVTDETTGGYNNTAYRVIGGVHDPVDAHDAATKGYVDANAGGDTVYSTKTTSNRADGGAVYIGNLDANQDEQPDPTTTDNHWRYFWALPNDNAGVPQSNSINIFGQNEGNRAITLGINAIARLENQVAIGPNTLNSYSATSGVAIGSGAQCLNANAVAIGRNAKTTRGGEVNVGAGTSGNGYNNTDYRVIGGVHDGQDAHDALTVGQANALIDAINSALNTNIAHIGS